MTVPGHFGLGDPLFLAENIGLVLCIYNKGSELVSTYTKSPSLVPSSIIGHLDVVDASYHEQGVIMHPFTCKTPSCQVCKYSNTKLKKSGNWIVSTFVGAPVPMDVVN
jgi:hypothetical protein